MRSRDGWERQLTTEPIKVRSKTYKHLVEFKRACASCNEPFSIFVTQKIADGNADSNSFGLRNCEKHRKNGNVPEAVTMANNVMKQELEGCYKTIAELKARLARYELQPAMEQHAKNNFPWS